MVSCAAGAISSAFPPSEERHFALTAGDEKSSSSSSLSPHSTTKFNLIFSASRLYRIPRGPLTSSAYYLKPNSDLESGRARNFSQRGERSEQKKEKRKIEIARPFLTTRECYSFPLLHTRAAGIYMLIPLV